MSQFDIGILFKNRFNYLKITLATLNEAIQELNLPVEVNLYNNNSTKELPTLSKQYNLIQFDCEQNQDVRVKKLIDKHFEISKKPFGVFLDSDIVLHPQSLITITKMINDFPDLGIGSIFNTNNTSLITSVSDLYETRPVIGAISWVVNRNCWFDLSKFVNSNIDVNFPTLVHNSQNWKAIVTKNSFVEHIGFNGLHTHNKYSIGHPLSIDRAYNFFD